MPSLADYSASNFAKVLILGDSGSGKTGALASLVKAGYNLKIVDFDNGLPILVSQIKKLCPERLGSVEYDTFTDKFQNLGGKPVPVTADAWRNGIAYLDKLQKVGFKSHDIVVLDTMTFAAAAAMRFVLKLENRVAGPPQLQDWGAAMDLTENLIAMLTSEDFACNVIVNSHIVFIGDEGAQRGYPATLGQKLSPKIGRYFNGCLLLRSMGSGAAVSRKLITNTYTNIELKTPSPDTVRPDYPIATGLAEYFKAIGAPAPQ